MLPLLGMQSVLENGEAQDRATKYYGTIHCKRTLILYNLEVYSLMVAIGFVWTRHS